jgi:hypothetical protein
MEVQAVQNSIFEVRDRRVMLDFDLARLYKVETKNLNLSVKRNMKRFPVDFMCQLTEQEWNVLRLQIETSNPKRGGRRYLPYAFTEQGVSMLSGLLNSDVAIEVNRSITRAFVALRHLALTSVEIKNLALENAEIRAKLELLERADEDNLEAINDLSEDTRQHIDNLYNAIGELSVKTPQLEKSRKPIGFKRGSE